MYTCQICKKDNLKSIAKHIFNSHKEITIEQYYCQYFLKDPTEGICNVCGKKCNFINITKGYHKHCSTHCTQIDPLTRKKSVDTYFKKTGYTHNMRNPESFLNRKIDPDQMQKMAKKYWDNISDEDKEMRNQKIRDTCLEKYGVDNPFKDIKHIQKKTFEKYGVINANKLDSVKEKIKKTNIKNFGFSSWYQTETCRNKHREYHINNVKKKILDNIRRYNLNIKLIDLIKEDGYNFKFLCLDCNKEFILQDQMFYIRIGRKEKICLECNPFKAGNFSYLEKEVVNYIKSIYAGEVVEGSKKIINPLQIDIYLPDLKLGIEFNGLYYHSKADSGYHLNKTNMCEEKNIHLIHIYEDDWMKKRTIVESRIRNLLNKNYVVYARKCQIKEINYKESKEFLEEHHIQGFVGYKYSLGLFLYDELVSIMSFGKMRRNLGQKIIKENEYELLRFCSCKGLTVTGAANRLFKHFIKNHNPEKIISYADRSWSTTNKKTVYDILGFSFEKTTQPNYYYVIKGKRENRFKYRKSELVKQGFNESLTENEIMAQRGILKIYDSGSLKYVWIL